MARQALSRGRIRIGDEEDSASTIPRRCGIVLVVRSGTPCCGAKPIDFAVTESAARQLAGISRRLFGKTAQHAHADYCRRTSASLASPGPFRPTAGSRSSRSPLLVDGILYFTVPDNIWAVDARSGHQIWHYTYPPTTAVCTSVIAALPCTRNGSIFMTPDAHLICLNAKDGTVRWNVQVADSHEGLLDHDGAADRARHVIVGVSGDFDNLSGFLRSSIRRPARRNGNGTRRPPAGTPNATTGGMTWMTGTYDPDAES